MDRGMRDNDITEVRSTLSLAPRLAAPATPRALRRPRRRAIASGIGRIWSCRPPTVNSHDRCGYGVCLNVA